MQEKNTFKMTLIAVFLISLATLCFELLQTRILSAIHWNHLVYLTVTIALIGFGISGAFVSIYGRRLEEKPRFYLTLFSLLFALSIVISFLTTIYIVQIDELKAIFLKMIFSYFILSLPFFFAGATLVLVFRLYADKINLIYFINLLGSGLGCLLFIFFVQPLTGPGMVFLVSLLGLLSALFFMNFKMRPRGLFWLIIVLIPAGIFCMFKGDNYFIVKPQAYKILGRAYNTKNHPDAVVEKAYWTPLARIELSSDKKNHLAWSSYKWIKSPADFKLITIDGDAFTLLTSKRFIESLYDAIENNQDDLICNLVYRIKEKPEVLVIGVGGGYDIYVAEGYGAKKITGLEINNAMYDITMNDFTDYTGDEIHQDHIDIVHGEGRSFVRRSKDKYDIIQIHSIDTFAALSSGAYVLSENYLFTVESFIDYFSHLKNDGGILSIQRHHFRIPRETLRLAVLGIEAYKALGVPEDVIQKSIFIASGVRNHGLLLFKNGAFSEGEVLKLLETCEAMNFLPHYIPKIFPDAQQKMLEEKWVARAAAREEEKASEAYNTLITAGVQGIDRDASYKKYFYNVTPVYDNKPFFFQCYKFMKSLKTLSRFQHRGVWPQFTLYILLIITFLTTLFLILIPLWIRQKKIIRLKANRGASLYFWALGLGFMFVELGPDASMLET